MTRKSLFISLIGVVASLIFSPRFFATAMPEAVSVADSNHEETDSLEKQSILRATIHIIIYPKRSHETGRGSHQYQQIELDGEHLIERARGLGTVVTFEEHVLIISHDHWEWESGELDHVELRNADNELLLELSGEAFSNIIRFRDGGTMIFEAPGIILSPGIIGASLSADRPIVPGSVVQIVHRQGEHRQQIDVQAALVESTSDRNGQQILNLRNLGGQSINRGDSGGGVWIGGQVLGNLWKTVTVESHVQETRIWGSRKFVVTTADTCIAAKFPLDLMTLKTLLSTTTPSESVER